MNGWMVGVGVGVGVVGIDNSVQTRQGESNRAAAVAGIRWYERT